VDGRGRPSLHPLSPEFLLPRFRRRSGAPELFEDCAEATLLHDVQVRPANSADAHFQQNMPGLRFRRGYIFNFEREKLKSEPACSGLRLSYEYSSRAILRCDVVGYRKFLNMTKSESLTLARVTAICLPSGEKAYALTQSGSVSKCVSCVGGATIKRLIEEIGSRSCTLNYNQRFSIGRPIRSVHHPGRGQLYLSASIHVLDDN